MFVRFLRTSSTLILAVIVLDADFNRLKGKEREEINDRSMKVYKEQSGRIC
jgi:hypothetical protein